MPRGEPGLKGSTAQVRAAAAAAFAADKSHSLVYLPDRQGRSGRVFFFRKRLEAVKDEAE